MSEDQAIGAYQSGDDTPSGNLHKAVEILRERLSSVRVETLMADSDTALNVRFLGDGANLEERRLLVKNLAHYLPPALSIIGIEPEPDYGNKDRKSGSNTA
jgi:hypothetical protein